MDFKLQVLSKITKNTQIRVWMTKLWPYEVGEKIGDCSNVATSGTDVAESEHPNVVTLLHDVMTFGVSFSGFLAHF